MKSMPVPLTWKPLSKEKGLVIECDECLYNDETCSMCRRCNRFDIWRKVRSVLWFAFGDPSAHRRQIGFAVAETMLEWVKVPKRSQQSP